MPQISNDLIYEILKQLQSGQAEIKSTLADHTRQLIRIREDINTLRGDDLRRESAQAQMDVRLERIESRLNLNDA
ncbi:hypothetical protein JDN40_02430 [Rhodomicrobium vannielii ATCC 17100]|uniref:hypothetical protein n=1 Tax=Rhodomicrobium vannielii TaxID=1069 RepID=UPI00191A2FD4|nr:hypothetical protein [Rhodomicrobium vannielii]MBJ7532972.1 hypothetical protein [Rhodomicrobium vannielii ATCC 17100]